MVRRGSSEIHDVSPALPFVVDRFLPDTLQKPQFLSHAHKDHTENIAGFGWQIFCTSLTRDLVCLKFPSLLDTATFNVLELEEPTHVCFGGHAFTVKAVDANHCPGSCSFIFQGAFGTVVHTGDAQLSTGTVDRLLTNLEGAPVDLLYIDCTFGDSKYELPSQRHSVQEVLSLINWHSSAARVYLACEMLGTEPVLQAVSSAFDTQIYLPPVAADANNFQSAQLQRDRSRELQLLLPNAVTTSNSSSRFWLWGGRQLANAALSVCTADSLAASEAAGAAPLFLKPSTQQLRLSQEHLAGSSSGPMRPAPVMASAKHQGVRWEVLRALERLSPRAACPSCGRLDMAHLGWLQPLQQAEQELQRRLAAAPAGLQSALHAQVLLRGAAGRRQQELLSSVPSAQMAPEEQPQLLASQLHSHQAQLLQQHAVPRQQQQQHVMPCNSSKRQRTACGLSSSEHSPALRCRPPAAGPSLLDWLASDADDCNGDLEQRVQQEAGSPAIQPAPATALAQAHASAATASSMPKTQQASPSAVSQDIPGNHSPAPSPAAAPVPLQALGHPGGTYVQQQADSSAAVSSIRDDAGIRGSMQITDKISIRQDASPQQSPWKAAYCMPLVSNVSTTYVGGIALPSLDEMYRQLMS